MSTNTKQENAELFAGQSGKSCTSDNPCESNIVLAYTLCVGIVATSAAIAMLIVTYIF